MVTRVQLGANGEIIEGYQSNIATEPAGATFRDIDAENAASRQAAASIGRGDANLINHTRELERDVAEQANFESSAKEARALAEKARHKGDTAVESRWEGEYQRLTELARVRGEIIEAKIAMQANARVRADALGENTATTEKLQAQLDQQIADGVFDNDG